MSSTSRTKKKVGSYPSISVIFSITLALFVIGLFGVLLVYSNELERVVRENFKVQVFLKNELTDSVKTTIKSSLSNNDFVLPQTLSFVSKEEARKNFVRETGEDFSLNGENLLREYFQFGVQPVFQDSIKLSVIKQSLEKVNGVFQVYYVVSSVSAINKNRTQIGLILIGVAVILFLVAVLLINNTLRLALFSQRFLIRSMQLVGATRWFIKKPFLLRSVWYGLLSGLLSSGLLIGLVYLATRRIPELSSIQNNRGVLIVLAGITGLGIFVALISSYRAVSKYLQLSLDELY